MYGYVRTGIGAAVLSVVAVSIWGGRKLRRYIRNRRNGGGQ
jgi:hypothetical protein